jgi:vancomycin resistance protein YoaR
LTQARDYDRRKQAAQPRRGLKRRLSLVQFRALVVAGIVVAVLLLVILVDAFAYYNKIHSGVTVAGQDMGGLTRDEATSLLDRFVAQAEDKPITLASGGESWELLPADVGTQIDVEGAVAEAMGYTRDSNFVVDVARRLKLVSGHHDITLLGTVDSEKMDAFLAMIAGELDDPPIDAGLKVLNGKIEVVDAESGYVVDQATLREQLKELLFSLHASDVEIPMVVKEPSVQAEDNQAAQQQAEIMISSSVRLTTGDSSWTITPEQIATYMDFRAEDQGGVSTLVPFLSAEKMGGLFDQVAAAVGVDPVNATWDSDGTQAWVVDSVQGSGLDAEKTAEALTGAALETSGRTAEVAVETVEPDLTTEEAEAMGITDKLGGCQTSYGGGANRRQNVRMATKYVNNILLAPGEEFNFIQTIGPRTADRGFLTAPGIVGPGKLEDVYGGGICQVSTTLFNAALEAGLKITERRNHSIYIDHYPKGRDATVSDVSPNLRFVNDTDNYILIRGTSDGVVTIYSIYGTSDGRKTSFETSDFYNIVTRSSVTVTDPSLGISTTSIMTEGQDGKQCVVTRTISWPDGRTKVDKFYSTWPVLDKEIAVGTATTTPTTTTVPVTTTTINTVTTELPSTTETPTTGP